MEKIGDEGWGMLARTEIGPKHSKVDKDKTWNSTGWVPKVKFGQTSRSGCNLRRNESIRDSPDSQMNRSIIHNLLKLNPICKLI